MPRVRARLCYVDFERSEFSCPPARGGKITQPQINSIWLSLPTTGAAWVERGKLYVQNREGGKVFDLGEVATGADPKKVPRRLQSHGSFKRK